MTSSQMYVDCTTCPVRGLRCEDCILHGIDAYPNPFTGLDGLALDANEARAVAMLARTGLVSQEVAASASAEREQLRLFRATG